MVGLLLLYQEMTITVPLYRLGRAHHYHPGLLQCVRFICSVARRALTAERRCLGRRDDRPRDVHTQCVPPRNLPEGLNHRVSVRQPSIKCIVFAQIIHARLMAIHIACELSGPNADVLNGAMIAVRAQRVLPSYLL
jgi:hypothetical protein